MNIYLIYLLNILIIGMSLAIFEIILEKNNGWGSNLPKDKWFAKQFFPNSKAMKLLLKISKTSAPLNYHFLVFIIIIPAIFIFEYFSFANNILLIFASFVGVLVFEDFFWFLCNWYFDSLKQLLKGPNGSIVWHKSWVKISLHHYLPTSYFIAFPISIFLLILAGFQ